MKDAIGGVLSLNLILIFLVIISCYLAFSVNYTKAFRVKNEVRNIIEKNEGLNCGALKQINELMVKSNYDFPDEFGVWCAASGYTEVSDRTGNLDKGGFCYKKQLVNKYGTPDYVGAYYTVATFTNFMSIPLFGGMARGSNDLMRFLGNTFVIKGETALIYSSGTETTTPGLETCSISDTSDNSKSDQGYILEK